MKLNPSFEALLGDIPYLKNARGEHAICNRIAIELSSLSRLGKLNCVWFHVANERRSSLNNIRSLIAVGMIPGVSDYVMLAKNKTVCIEVKCGKGRLSDKQVLFREWCENCGIPYYCVFSWSEFKSALVEERLMKDE